MGNTRKLFINNVKTTMARKGWGQVDLARALKSKPSAVSRALSEDSPSPNLETIEKMADALGVSPQELLKPAMAAEKTPEPTRASLLGSILIRITSLDQDELGSVVHALEAIEGLRSPAEALQLRKNKK